jgi:hypothetical protein
MNIIDFIETAGIARASGMCPCCGASVNESDFRDTLSVKEFGISGMCQSCQDSVFGV